MKIAFLIGDGMGDYPLDELGGKSPLQTASLPNIRRVAASGVVRLVRTVPDGMLPGSDVANLSIMGFNPSEYYTGRAPIEAVGAGITMKTNEAAFRCNFITVEHDLIKDNTADHITTEEARQLIDDLNNSLGMDGLRFVTGMGYRHLLIWDNGPVDTITTPPHDVLDQPVQTYLPKGNRHDEVIKLMEESKRILSNHPVNQVRIKAGKNAATQIWLWGQGRKTFLPSYQKMYGLTGSVISAVDLVKGIGLLAGLKAVQVPGATGFIDTDFAGKVKAAMDVLSEHDFVFVHVEAPDECSHMGNLNLKIKAMEAFDREIVGPIWQCLQTRGEAYRLVIGTDHRTPVVRRCHTAEPVPIALLEGPVSPTNAEAQFDEFVNGGHVSGMAFELLQTVLKR